MEIYILLLVKCKLSEKTGHLGADLDAGQQQGDRVIVVSLGPESAGAQQTGGVVQRDTSQTWTGHGFGAALGVRKDRNTLAQIDKG